MKSHTIALSPALQVQSDKDYSREQLVVSIVLDYVFAYLVFYSCVSKKMLEDRHYSASVMPLSCLQSICFHQD